MTCQVVLYPVDLNFRAYLSGWPPGSHEIPTDLEKSWIFSESGKNWNRLISFVSHQKKIRNKFWTATSEENMCIFLHQSLFWWSGKKIRFWPGKNVKVREFCIQDIIAALIMKWIAWIFLITVTIYVNHNCACGPYFDPRKVKAMPAQFGSGSILSIARDIFQTFLMAAMSPRQMLSLIKRGEGELITLNLDSKSTTVRLPIFLEEDDFYVYVRRQLEDLCACEHMLFKRKEACTKCPIQQPQSANREEVSKPIAEKRRWSGDNQNATTTTPVQPTKIVSNSASTTINASPSSPTAAKQPRKSVPGKNKPIKV